MANKKKTEKNAVEEAVCEYHPQQSQEPVLPVMSGIFIIMVTILGGLCISRFVLHRWEVEAVQFDYMIYETVLTVILSAALIVFLNYIRVSEACEKAKSPEDFPCGGPFGFLAANPFILWLELSVIFGILFTGVNGLLFKLLGFTAWKPILFLLYKIVYSLIMCIMIHWFALGRMLQLDWLNKKIFGNKASFHQPKMPKR